LGLACLPEDDVEVKRTPVKRPTKAEMKEKVRRGLCVDPPGEVLTDRDRDRRALEEERLLRIRENEDEDFGTDTPFATAVRKLADVLRGVKEERDEKRQKN
jgi:hypothetical protein